MKTIVASSTLTFLVLLACFGTPQVADAAYKDLTPKCGGLDQVACEYARAKKTGAVENFACSGKDVHFSPRHGGECWSCPKGYKRTVNSITGKKACAKEYFKGPWKPATFVGTFWGCNAYETQRGKSCYKCPKGYKISLRDADGPKACKVKDEYQCDFGLRVDDNKCRAPDDIFTQARKRKAANSRLISKATALVAELNNGSARSQRIRDAIKARKWSAAGKELQTMQSYNDLVSAGASAEAACITIGFTADAQAIAGVNSEMGVAIDLNGRPLKGYSTTGWSVGAALGGEAGITVGIWGDDNDKIGGKSQGVVMGLSVPAGGGAGMWFSYPPGKSWGVHRYLGLTVGVSGGFSAEAIEYNRVETTIL